MFALITYKNLFPRDFSDLQLGRGFVFSLFSQKKEFIAAEEERQNKLIEDNYLSTNMVGEDTCEGYVIIEKTFKGIEYYPYIKCEEYTTVDYE